MKLTIYGASDDLIEIDADGPCKGADEYNDYDAEKRPHAFEIVAPDGASMLVRVGFDGCWWVAPCLVSEDVPFPDWPLEITRTPDSDGAVRAHRDDEPRRADPAYPHLAHGERAAVEARERAVTARLALLPDQARVLWPGCGGVHSSPSSVTVTRSPRCISYSGSHEQP